MKNKLLIASVKLAIIIYLISVCALDSESYIPYVTALVSLVYLYMFCRVNKKYLERWARE